MKSGAMPLNPSRARSVEARAGEGYDSGPMEPKWEPPTGLPTEKELTDKFLWLAKPVLGHEQAKQLAAFVLDLDSQEDLSPLPELMINNKPGG